MADKTIEEMDVIELTRALGKKIQQEEVFLHYQIAKQNADNDQELQKIIEDFSNKRIELSEESDKPEEEKNAAKIQQLSREMRRCYGEIMSNQSMINYNDAKDAYDVLMNRINAILQKSFDGEDPETADYSPTCSGSCATCGGCG